jgi:signal transduction histidine kinase
VSGGSRLHPEPPQGEDKRARDDVVMQAVARFLLWSVVALLVLVLATFVGGRRVAQQQALEDAEDRARRLAQVVGRLVTDDVHAGMAGASEPLDTVLVSRFEDGYLSRARVWAPDGRVLWADDPELVGRSYPLAEQARSLLGTSEVHAELATSGGSVTSDGDEPEEFLDVYAGTFDAGGGPLLLEAQVATDHMNANEAAIIRGLAPVGIGALLLFQVAVLPMAVSLGRRVRRTEAARVRMARQALEASELERRRIAQELHDGVVQDLAGIGFTLPAVRRAVADGPGSTDAVALVEQVEELLQRDIAALRSMMIDVYPPDLHHTGLLDAVEDLASGARERGLTVVVETVGSLDVPIDVARLTYRVCREGLHNVVKHARARSTTVRIERTTAEVTVRVCDDGRGLPVETGVDEGSLGLKLLSESIDQVGGSLSLLDGAHLGSGGASLVAVLPLLQPPAPQGSSKPLRSWWARWAA